MRVAHDAYLEHQDKLRAQLPDASRFLEVGLPDCRIVAERFVQGDLILDIDSTGGFSKIDRLSFINACITEDEGNIDDAIWLADELYLTKDHRYELQMIVQKCGMQLIYRTIEADDILVNECCAESRDDNP